ncbi:MAG: hypothetical protein IIX14_03175 [Clostridia bacterium]|nr:hypothetical protein [Clostridia bacterium]
MKATKRIVCLTLALIMTALAFIMPVSAATTVPLIMIDGIGTTKLYKNFGTAEEELVFSGDEEFITGIIEDAGGALLGGLISFGIGNKDFDALADKVMPVVNKYISPIGFNSDGTPVDPTIGFYRTTEPISKYTEEEKANLSSFALAYAERNGEEYVYNFTYDWRADPIENAEQLKDFITEVKAKTNSKRVNMVAMSQGSTVALAYLNAYGGHHLKNIVFAAPAWQGTSTVGDVVTNNIELDAFTLENYLVQLANGSATTHIAAYILAFIATYDGLTKEYLGDLNAFATGLLPRTYTDAFIPYFAGMPGIWSLCPAEYYEVGKEFIFDSHGVAIDPAYEAKIDAYHQIQVNAKSIVEKAMANGANFYIVCGYNCQNAPISPRYESSDGVIETEYMSGGATCADYLKAHNDWGRIYNQKIKDGHNHVSWDYKVDASTCMFPEYTWFIKNQQHNNYKLENGTMDIVMWLLEGDNRVTVTTDTVNYPQFWLYNTYKRTTKAMVNDEVLGDLDSTGAVNTIDARVALKLASGQLQPSDLQYLVGDIDEDGEFSTEDARSVLSIAAGLPC